MSDVVLTTRRLRLRPFAPGDVDALHAHWTHPDVRRYLWDGREIARREAADVVEESIASFAARRFGFWAIELRDDPAVVGFVGLRPMPDPPDLELYYGLARPYWGRGLATEASRAVLRYAFEALAVDRVYIRTDEPNDASVRVVERLGASLRADGADGRVRDDGRVRGAIDGGPAIVGPQSSATRA